MQVWEFLNSSACESEDFLKTVELLLVFLVIKSQWELVILSIRPCETEFFEFCNKNKILRESYEYLVIAIAGTFVNLGNY